ncbi:MAG: metal-dependent hydrolase [Gemmatimonadales bacterium]
MFVGHLAVAIASKKLEPTVPLGHALAAAFGLDLLWPLLLLLGVETVRVSPEDTAFTALHFESYPWSHSLLMAVLWSVLFALFARRSLTPRVSILLGMLVASHWFLDVVTHRPDLPLWPGGPQLGAGLWNSVPATLLVEGTLLVTAVALYLRMTTPRDRAGTLIFLGLVALCGAIWLAQPWSPPPPSAAAVAWVGLALWLIPPWGAWAERHRAVVAIPSPGAQR